MNIEDRLLRLERSNRYYKVALALCLCLFIVSAKDVFVKDEIHSKIIYSDTIHAKEIILAKKEYIWGLETIISPGGIRFIQKDRNDSIKVYSDYNSFGQYFMGMPTD